MLHVHKPALAAYAKLYWQNLSLSLSVLAPENSDGICSMHASEVWKYLSPYINICSVNAIHCMEIVCIIIPSVYFCGVLVFLIHANGTQL